MIVWTLPMDLPDFLNLDSDQEISFKGHRIRLVEVCKRFNEGHSAEAIALDVYPTLDLATVYKGIAFYLENQAEVDELIARHDRAIETQSSAPTSTPGLEQLRRRMESVRRAEAS